ncbi:MAG TPA: O-antigen ligase family protein [Kiritimatiellia bacterium]|nr:O-antigen ligase family protein [Kiritimatiellia bacterium]HMP33444.1 O-antigen ligase family protein [Kiritimatiellia bacterium]
MIPQFLIPIIGVIAVVLVAFYGFTSRGFLVHFLLLAAPIGIYFVNNPTGLLITTYALFYSGLMMPGLPQGIQVVHAMMILFVGITVARNIISKPSATSVPPAHRVLYFFLILLGIVIYFRGLGLRATGSGLIGGASYIKLIFAAFFLFCARYYTLSPRQWRRLFILMFLGSLMPISAQLLFMLSGGTIYQQFNFVQPYVYGLIENLAGESGAGTFRLHGLAGVSSTLLVTALILLPFRGNKRLLLFVVIGLCMVMGLLSGFRSMVVEITVVTMLYILFSAPRSMRYQYLAFFVMAVLLLFALAIPLMPHLPYPVQRALSWLPFAEVSYLAQADATGSAQWRLQVWEYALKFVPQYLWIGRGFTFHISEIMSYGTRMDMILEAYVTHNYHSGIISLLLDLGLPGLVLGSLFLLLCIAYSLKPLPVDAEPFIRRAHTVFRVKMLFGCFSYFLIHGDVRSTFIALFVQLAILEGIRTTAIHEARKMSGASPPKGEAASTRMNSGTRHTVRQPTR